MADLIQDLKDREVIANEGIFMTRFPNIVGWIYRELQDSEAVIQSLADSVADEKLRAKFLSSEHLSKV